MTSLRTRIHNLAFLAIILAPLLLVSCSDDTTGPDSYPVVMRANSVKNVSEVKTYVNEGGVWKEISSENPEIANDSYFAEAAAFENNGGAFRLTSDTQWEADGVAGSASTYTKTGDKFVFATALPAVKVYATGDYEEFAVDYVSAVSTSWDGTISLDATATLSYDSSQDLFTQLDFDATALTSDTVALQTFQVVYKAD